MVICTPVGLLILTLYELELCHLFITILSFSFKSAKTEILPAHPLEYSEANVSTLFYRITILFILYYCSWYLVC